MLDAMTPHARMTHHLFGGSASSGSPRKNLPVMHVRLGLTALRRQNRLAWASPCVLAHLDLVRPRTYGAMRPNIVTSCT
jgi:hypothetical protein